MADQIKVNDAAWQALDKEHQDAINEIVSESFGNVSIVGDPATPAPQADAALKLPGGICKLLCQLAAKAGHIACKRLPAPAQPICNAGVDAAAALCQSKCK
jgi:hypothetical protein